MPKNKITARSSFTMIELMLVVGLIAMILFTGIGIVLVDAQKGWNRMYERIYSDVVTDGYAARRAFDREIRRASGERFLLDSDGDWLEVYSYADSNSISPDRYAHFYEDNGYLKVERGKLNPRETISTSTICGNVSNCTFKSVGRSAQMLLTLDNGSQTANIISSSVMQNY